MNAQTILVHGHRGARGAMPENTMPGFEYAIREGVDVLELDLAVTRDGIPVVSHDPVLPQAICTGQGTRVIREMTLEELQRWDCGSRVNPEFPRQKPVPGARVPTLDKVLALAPRGSFHFNIETKITPDRPEYTPPPEEFARLVLNVIRKHGLESRVILQSFDFRTLHAMKRLAPEIRLAALWAAGDRDFVAVARRANARIVSPHFRLVTSERVADAHAAGLEVIPWTANTPEVWDRLIEAKVNAIITDYPAELIAYLKRKGLR